VKYHIITSSVNVLRDGNNAEFHYFVILLSHWKCMANNSWLHLKTVYMKITLDIFVTCMFMLHFQFLYLSPVHHLWEFWLAGWRFFGRNV